MYSVYCNVYMSMYIMYTVVTYSKNSLKYCIRQITRLLTYRTKRTRTYGTRCDKLFLYNFFIWQLFCISRNPFGFVCSAGDIACMILIHECIYTRSYRHFQNNQEVNIYCYYLMNLWLQYCVLERNSPASAELSILAQ